MNKRIYRDTYFLYFRYFTTMWLCVYTSDVCGYVSILHNCGCVTICLCVYMAMCLYVCLCGYVSVCLCVYMAMCLYVCLCGYVSIHIL